MKRIFALFVLCCAAGVAHATDPVIKMQVAESVSADDAAESMKLRANMLNMKLVAELPLSKQVEAVTGQPQRPMAIYQFCDAVVAKRMVDQALDFAAYLPCRIALIQDAKGKNWLVMLNLDAVLENVKLPPELAKDAITVRDNLLNIMQAGAKGDL